MKILQRDVVWVSFPFTDGRSYKERPALVISNDLYNRTYRDILLCYITTQSHTEHLLPISLKDLEAGNLQKPSYLRFDKILLIDKSRILGVISVINKAFYRKAVHAICDFIQLSKTKLRQK